MTPASFSIWPYGRLCNGLEGQGVAGSALPYKLTFRVSVALDLLFYSCWLPAPIVE